MVLREHSQLIYRLRMGFVQNSRNARNRTHIIICFAIEKRRQVLSHLKNRRAVGVGFGGFDENGFPRSA